MTNRTAPPLSRDDEDFGTRAGFLVHDVSRMRRAFFDEAMRPYGLTRSQWWVLGQLSRQNGRPMSQGDLAKHLDVGKAALGSLVDKLEVAGYVERGTARGDRRIKLLTVTPKGREVTATLRRIGHGLNLEIFTGLTDRQVQALEQMLGLIKTNLRVLVGGLDGEGLPEEESGTRRAVPAAKSRASSP